MATKKKSKKWYKKSADGLNSIERVDLVRKLVEINVECEPNKRDILMHLNKIEEELVNK
jgi:hypothetical protein